MMDLHAMTDANADKMDMALNSIAVTAGAGEIHGNWA